MHRGFKNLVLSAAAILGVFAFAPTSVGQNPQITVSVFSDVPISPDLLASAEQRAQEIFVNVGVDITWINCTLTKTQSDPDPACRRGYGPDDFVLRITAHGSSATSDATFGVAFLGSDGRGRYADVFWNRAQELYANSKLGVDQILGSVMAHEMGHLLLGLHAHSVSGLMRARWGSGELRGINMGTLLFLPEQGKRMRARIADATSVLISSRAR
jgi:hypothetical protein